MAYEISDRSLLQKLFIFFLITVISLRLLIFVYKLLKPRVMAWFLSKFAHSTNEVVGQIKSDLFASMEQLTQKGSEFVVLEIGAGAGANFKFFPENSKVIAVEPNVQCNKYLHESANESSHVSVSVITSSVEDLSEDVKDESVDVVVCTYVLCSVHDTEAAMKEIKRVLKPSGRFYFLEHVRDSRHNSWTHIGQRIMRPIMEVVADCNCAKNTWTYIDRAGFKGINYRQVTGPKKFPPFLRPHLYGYVTK